MIMLMMALACAPKQAEVAPDLGPIPEVGEAPAFTPKKPEVATLDSGAKLWHVQDTGLPVVAIRIILPGGASSDGG